MKQQITEVQLKIAQEKALRDPADGERERMLAELQELQKENAELKTKMKLYEKCDPKRLEEIEANK